MPTDEEPERQPIELCIHAKLGQLAPYVMLTITAGPAFSTPEAGTVMRRVKCCAMCLGWVEAVTRFGLPLLDR